MALDKLQQPSEVVESPTPAAKPKKITLQAKGCNIMEPMTKQWFHDGTPTEVHELTEWLKCQIDAGLLIKL